MSFLNNISILKKLMIPVAMVVALTAGLIGIALTGFSGLVESMDSVVDQQAARLMVYSDLRSELNEATIQEKNIILEPDPLVMATYKARLNKTRETVVQGIERLKAMSVDETQRARVEATEKVVLDYLAVLDQSVALGLASRTEDARRFSANEGREARTAAGDVLEKSIARLNAELETAKIGAEDLAETDRNLILGGGIAGLVLVVGLMILMITRLVTRPMALITEGMRRLAGGDLDVAVDGLERKDEIGTLARSLEVFKANAVEVRRAAAEKAAEDAAKMRRAQKLQDLTDGFRRSAGDLVAALNASASDMEGTARSMSATAQDTSTRAVTVAGAAGQTSANVQTVAASAEELAASVGEISRRVEESSSIANSAVDEAEKADRMVQSLAAGAARIGTVVSLISDIADKTNLLALNATIEAARAGEAGRGFAVVASEVKELATQTSRATTDISAQIQEIQHATEGVVSALKGIGATIASMSSISAAVAASVEEQGAATQEISRNVQQAAQGTELVTNNIEDVRHAAAGAGAASEQVLAAARELSLKSARLGEEVQGFLAEVQAA